MQIIGMCDRVQPCYRPILLYKVHIWGVPTRPFIFLIFPLYFLGAQHFSVTTKPWNSLQTLYVFDALVAFQKNLTNSCFILVSSISFPQFKQRIFSVFILSPHFFVLYFNLRRGGYVYTYVRLLVDWFVGWMVCQQDYTEKISKKLGWKIDRSIFPVFHFHFLLHQHFSTLVVSQGIMRGL